MVDQSQVISVGRKGGDDVEESVGRDCTNSITRKKTTGFGEVFLNPMKDKF